MPFTATIPIIGNTDCTSGITVEYKMSTDTNWTRLDPAPVGDTIVLNNLSNNSTYNVRAAKKCCNGQFSTESTIDIITGGN